MSLQLIKSRWDRYLHSFDSCKHTLIAATIFYTIYNIVRYFNFCNLRRHYYESAINTTTIVELQKYGIDEYLVGEMPMVLVKAIFIAGAVYNIIFIVITYKEFLKGVTICLILECALFILSTLTRVRNHNVFYQRSDEYLDWSCYMIVVHSYWNALKHKKEKEKNSS